MEKHERARKGENDFEKYCNNNGEDWLKSGELITAIERWRNKDYPLVDGEGKWFNKAVANRFGKSRALIREIETWIEKKGKAGIFDYLIWKRRGNGKPSFVEVKTGDIIKIPRSQFEFYLEFSHWCDFALFKVLPRGVTGRSSYWFVPLGRPATVRVSNNY